MSPTRFLCCLPARLGVFLFSLVETLGAGFLAAVLIILLIHNQENHDLSMTKFTMIACIGWAVVAVAVCLTSFAGFMGAILRNARGVRAYSTAIAWLFGVQVIWGIVGIVALWVEPKELLKACTAAGHEALCSSHLEEAKGIVTGAIVVLTLVHAYQFHVVSSYAIELELVRDNRESILGRSKYAPVGLVEPMMGQNSSYAYADAPHSYGPSYA
ncbi:hypothetical protein HWV62_7437 [Athelia sp. TMB]|nr:hypothetical protein HWV62_7437 [Athelia sp. TMB]